MAAISLFYDTNKGSFSKGVFERCTPTGNEVFFHFKAPRHYQICISKCVYYYRDDLSKTLGKTTVQKNEKRPLPVDMRRSKKARLYGGRDVM